MRVPVWLTLGVAALVCVFGAYRIRIAFRSDEDDERARTRKGLYAMRRRTHFLIGVIYLLLSIYGLLIDHESAANFVPIDYADNWLHLVLAVGMLGLGAVLGRTRTTS